MKKFFRILLSALMVTSFVACNQYTVQYDWESHRNDNQDDEVDPQGDPVEKTFNASLAKGSFAKDDEITIFWGKSAVSMTTAAATAAGSSSSFTCDVVEAGNYWAVYPASVGAAYKGKSTLSVTLPTEQSGSGAATNIEYATTTGDALSFAFAEASAYLKLTVTRKDIAQITIKGTNGEKIAGSEEITFSENGNTVSSDNGSSTIWFPSQEFNGTIAPGDYVFAIMPGMELKEGFTLTCRDVLKNIVVAPFVSEAKTTAAGATIDLGIVDQTGGDFITEYYVTPDGAGDKSGKDWENALDPAGFRTILGMPAKTDGYPFHFAGGTYILTDPTVKYLPIAYENVGESVSTQFYGGYDPSSTGKDLTKRDPAQWVTEFSGDNKYAGFAFGVNTNFTFDGITISGYTAIADFLSSVRGAIGVTANSAKVTINNCFIRDNVENATGETSKQGGAAMFISKGAVYVTNTIITGNSSESRGAAIRNDGSGVLFMNHCALTNNTLSNGAYGMAMFVKANTAMNDCLVYGNHATDVTMNNPSLNINNNVIMTNMVIIDDSFFSTGTGTIRAEMESTSGYAGFIMNTVVINTHPFADTDNVAWCILPRKVGLSSGGHNIFSAKDGAANTSGNFTLAATDREVASIEELGVSYSYDESKFSLSWTGEFSGGFSFAPMSDVKNAVKAIAPEAGSSTIGKDFVDWLTEIGVITE